MNLDPDLLKAAGDILAVNAVATLVLAVMSYLLSKWALDGLEWLDRWLDPSRKHGKVEKHPAGF
jgi:hypothetical protein